MPSSSQKDCGKEGWLEMVELMRTWDPATPRHRLPQERIAGILSRTRDENNRLAEYLVSFRGADSGDVPFHPMLRRGVLV